MVRSVQVASAGSQQFNRLANAAWLVDAALLGNGQMHGQVQERVGFVVVCVDHFEQGCIHVLQVGMVFGVFGYPLTGYYFNGFLRSIGFGFGVNRAKKLADVGLAGGKHAPIIPWWQLACFATRLRQPALLVPHSNSAWANGFAAAVKPVLASLH